MAGYPTEEQTVPAGADPINDWLKVMQGPFNATQRTSDGVFKTGAGFVHGITFNNGSGAAVTFNIYDDASSTTNPMLTVTVPAGVGPQHVLNAQFYNALRVTASLWTSATVSATWR